MRSGILVCLFVAVVAATVTFAVPQYALAGTTQSVSFSLEDAKSISNLHVRISHSVSKGSFVGEGVEVECAPNPELSAMFAIYECVPSEPRGCTTPGVLNVAMITESPVQGPIELVSCEFDAEAGLSAQDFSIEVVDAGTTIAGRVVPQTINVSADLAEE